MSNDKVLFRSTGEKTDKIPKQLALSALHSAALSWMRPFISALHLPGQTDEGFSGPCHAVWPTMSYVPALLVWRCVWALVCVCVLGGRESFAAPAIIHCTGPGDKLSAK